MHSIVTTFRGAVIKVELASFCAAMDTLIDQDGFAPENPLCGGWVRKTCSYMLCYSYNVITSQSGAKPRAGSYVALGHSEVQFHQKSQR